MKIGLFFGSFNPIHIGHLMIANYFVSFSDLEEVWLVLSPHNPHKEKKDLLNGYERLHLIEKAIHGHPKIKACQAEFNLPQPNYTINTLTFLKEKYPQQEFIIIMGEDNLSNLNKWKNYEKILERYEIYTYPRANIEKYDDLKGRIKKIKAPIIEISSSFIRKAIKEKKNVEFFLPNNLYDYLIKQGYYQ